jgi:hypothetical protein
VGIGADGDGVRGQQVGQRGAGGGINHRPGSSAGG